MAVVRIDLAYDGSGFHGFARQPGLRTVQGEVETALERLLGHPVETTGAARTDAGVHARRQAVTFSADDFPDLGRLGRRLAGILGPEVGVWDVAVAPDGFDARFSAAWRAYRYFVDPRPAADPLRRHAVWHLGRALDIDAMNEAAAHYPGTHDFAAFCRRRPGATTVREVLQAGWGVEEDLAVFSVQATAFCHQMVRSLVGLCVDVGLGRMAVEVVAEVMASGDRQRVGTIAPPHGLVLWEVGFQEPHAEGR